MNLRILFSLVLVCIYFYSSNAYGNFENCCLSYAKGVRVHSLLKRVNFYRMQEVNDNCNKRAIQFYLPKRNRVICGDPQESWVKSLKHKIDRMRYQSPKNKI
ncbi:C-C motif chemokine 25 [Microcaecilia unicolor]|uniref:C-C motif chemokine 25 n=1 Tax=Microcaecilia unicolor TaxID=1415580 RepID=A0A6P7ZMS3_9AMPH|nr:C-C motif chemokine 25 [Microcaecilia unicolor]